jgi:hypothetical protein
MSGSRASSASAQAFGHTSAHGAAADPFAWLDPRAAPAGWPGTRIASGAVMYYPAGWQTSPGDKGTATAILLDTRQHIRGYLNLTPRQGAETLAGWAAFRVHHNTEEGDTDVRGEGSAQALRFRTGHGSCVRDRYTTVTGAHYIELACLVAGAQGSSVIVAAASPAAWPQLSPLLERAISAFTT